MWTPPPGTPVLIERTAKKYKAWGVIATLIVFAGVMLCLLIPKEGMGIGLLLIAVGIVLRVINRIGTWWNHE